MRASARTASPASCARSTRRCRRDTILGPMYPADDLPGAEERLRDFLVGRFGGPQRYIEQRGHPRLRMRHMPFAIDRAARDRWVELMDRALDEAALDPGRAQLLREFLHGMATFMINRPTAGGSLRSRRLRQDRCRFFGSSHQITSGSACPLHALGNTDWAVRGTPLAPSS